MYKLVYYSSQTGNTDYFVQKLGINSIRIPINMKVLVEMREPYVLVLPTYAAGDGRGSVPKSIIKFLNHEPNRNMLEALIVSGNKNFGENYCIGGRIVAAKCNVPILYDFELRGTEEDVFNVKNELNKFWNTKEALLNG